MTQIIAGISPLPVVEIRAIPSAADPNHGFYLLAVPRSPRGPHAVPVNGGLRYPKRNGSTIRYLSEPEVADAYRQRAFGGQNQTDRLDEILDDALARLDKSDYPWLVVALMPELPGNLVIDSAGFTVVQAQLVGRSQLFFDGTSYMHAGVGRRRYVLGGGSNQTAEKYLAADLHTDGGAFAEQLEDVRRNHAIVADNSVPYLISDESVVEGLITGLLTLGQHARDRAAAGGNVLVRATLVPTARPIEIGHARDHEVLAGSERSALLPGVRISWAPRDQEHAFR
jgi:hypothetical protein